MTMDNFATVGEVAAAVPGALAAFQALKIDFCCGGKRPLLDVLSERDTTVEAFSALADKLSRERRGSADGQDFQNMSPAVLSFYIEDTHHDYLRRALPEIDDLLLRVLRAHGANHPEVFEVYKLYGQLMTELNQHLIREEILLFPEISAGGRPEALARTIVAEHEAAGEILERLRAVTEDYKIPDDACLTYRRAYEMLRELEGDLHQHIHLENNILLKDLAE